MSRGLTRGSLMVLISLSLALLFAGCGEAIPDPVDLLPGGDDPIWKGGVATPVFKPTGRSFTGSIVVEIACATDGATIRVTDDMTDPSPTHGMLYVGPITLTQLRTTTLKAIAYKDGMPASRISVAKFSNAAPTDVEAPQFDPAESSFAYAQDVTITSQTAGASIRYTTDESNPTSTHGRIYTGSIRLADTTTVKAIAYKAGMDDSPVTSAYFVNTQQGNVAPPVLSPAEMSFTDSTFVTITSLTPGATIRYTIDGSNPTSSSPLVYSDPIRLTDTATIKTIAYKGNMADSAVVSATYTRTGGEEPLTIVLADAYTLPEQTAAEELAYHLPRATGRQFQIVAESEAPADGPRIFVGQTQFAQQNGIPGHDALETEEWIVRSVDHNALVITGGRPRGTLYAAYHYLEDIVGVRWWNPWEYSIASVQTLPLNGLNLQDKPVFNYRDMYSGYLVHNDNGRYSARNRYNRQGDDPISGKYGGEVGYGPPYHVHTFYLYIPPNQYFSTNPEYFSLINGQRQHQNGQLCLTNQNLRNLMVQKLRNYITTSRNQATQNNVPPPKVYEISPNDWMGACQCVNCQAIAQAEGSEAGPLFDFVNYLADDIKDDYPDIMIGTLAYLYSERPPNTIRPRNNVSIRLCDTRSNIITDLLSNDNASFRNLLLNWAPLSDNLRIWNYGVTFGEYSHFPKPTLRTYVTNYRFYAENSVEGIFTEHPGKVVSDMRDLKFWVMAKLHEDPYRDYDALLEDFTNGFYGPADPYIRQYLAALEASVQTNQSYISLRPTPPQHRYLNMEFMIKAHGLFDAAQAAVGHDTVLRRRVSHARLSLDRATGYLFSVLMNEWVSTGRTRETFPFDKAEVCERFRQAWYNQADLRYSLNQRAGVRASADAEVEKIMNLPDFVPPPSEFSHLPLWRIHDFPPHTAFRYQNIAVIAEDPEAELGETVRLEFPTPVDSHEHTLAKYRLPIRVGIFDPTYRLGPDSRAMNIYEHEVPGPGYQWYRLKPESDQYPDPSPIVQSDYLWFFWSWIIKYEIGAIPTPEISDQVFEFWIKMKFEGPAFPYGEPGDKNAISIERVTIIDVTEY